MMLRRNTAEVAGLMVRGAREALARKHVEEAMALLERAIGLAPACVDAHILRGLVFAHRKQHASAVECFRGATLAAPDSGEAWLLLGTALFDDGQPMPARNALKRACTLVPRSASAWYGLGRTDKLLGNFAAAEETLQRALSLNPGSTVTRLALADVAVTQGHIGAAVACYRELLKFEPGNAHAWFGLANLKVYAFDAAQTTRLQRVVERSTCPEADRVLLEFALAKALEDQGDYIAAWRVLGQANARERRRRPWDRHRFRHSTSRMIEVFKDMPPCACSGARGKNVILVVSMPRSGSTLVEQILASHPEVTGGNEINVLTEIIAAESRRHGVVDAADWISIATPADWARLGNEYLEQTAYLHEATPRLVDKSLDTWKWLGPARQMLPGAHFVYCHRDPVEVCFSCYRQYFARGCRFSYNLDDLASYCADYERLMAFWMSRYPNAFFDLGYEDLVEVPAGVIHQLLAFCGLPFAPACMTPERTARPVTSAASAAQVRQPIRRRASTAQRYGELLDPLRERLRSYVVAQPH